MKYRHGDVILLEPVPLPAAARKRAGNVVAEGEVTGHAHRVFGGDVYEEGGRMFLTGRDTPHLKHEEHARVDFLPTTEGMAYPVIIQREYDDEKEWRQVAD